jgi:hypothetical protein
LGYHEAFLYQLIMDYMDYRDIQYEVRV